MRYLEACACGWLARIAERSRHPSASGLHARAERILSELDVPNQHLRPA
jgi:hypothetical protein